MVTKATFSKADLARKMAAQFGEGCEPGFTPLLHTKGVNIYLHKIEEAHRKAASSTLYSGECFT